MKVSLLQSVLLIGAFLSQPSAGGSSKAFTASGIDAAVQHSQPLSNFFQRQAQVQVQDNDVEDVDDQDDEVSLSHYVCLHDWKHAAYSCSVFLSH